LGTLFGLAPVTRFDAVANRFAYLAGVRHPITVYGDGSQRRPLVHVIDASAALVHLLKMAPAETETVYNLVGTTVSVTEIVDAIHQTAPTAAVQFNDQDILNHISFDVDSAKLRETGWQPKISLSEGLGDIINRFTGLRRFMPHRGELDDL
jgi:UDP-glucose 4-epimerase